MPTGLAIAISPVTVQASHSTIVNNNMLLEDGFNILLEDGSYLLLET